MGAPPGGRIGTEVPDSAKSAPSWPDEAKWVSKRLELACTRFLTLVSEIAAKIEYIDFGWLPDWPQIA